MAAQQQTPSSGGGFFSGCLQVVGGLVLLIVVGILLIFGAAMIPGIPDIRTLLPQHSIATQGSAESAKKQSPDSISDAEVVAGGTNIEEAEDPSTESETSAPEPCDSALYKQMRIVDSEGDTICRVKYPTQFIEGCNGARFACGSLKELREGQKIFVEQCPEFTLGRTIRHESHDNEDSKSWVVVVTKLTNNEKAKCI